MSITKGFFDLIHSFIRKRLLIALVCGAVLVLPFAASADSGQRTDQETTLQLVKRAEKLTRQGGFAEAEDILRNVIRVSPRESRARLALALIFLKQKKLNEAYDLSFDVALAERQNSLAFAILGGALLASGSFKEATLSFNNSLLLDRKQALAWAGLGMLDFYENRIQQSLVNLREAVYIDSSEPDYAFALGQVASRAERYSEAAEAYGRFLRIALKYDDERRERIRGLIKFLRFLGNRESLYRLGGESQATVPLELVGNRPIVKMKVNNSDEPLEFVLDTGSSISVISRETAKKLNIKPVAQGGVARALGGNGKFEIVYGFLRSVDIGGVKVKNIPVYIREFDSSGRRFSGYIGLSLISKFLTTVDYGEKTFSLTRKDVANKQGLAAEPLSLPLRLTSSGFLSGQVQLEGVESTLNFIVDTGASISVISDDLASSKEISPFVNGETMRVIGAAGFTDNVQAFLLPRVTFGSHSRRSLKAIALDLDLINEASGFEQAGILGGNFLKNYRLTFDFENSTVLFVPISQ